MSRESYLKNISLVLVEGVAILLMVLRVLPREASLVITGLLIFYFIFSSLEDSLWVFIASTPLFVALPITAQFDSVANWRLLLSVIFLVYMFKQMPNFSWSSLWSWIRQQLKQATRI